MEVEILEIEFDELAPNSRLGCQIVISEGIESITARIVSINNF